MHATGKHWNSRAMPNTSTFHPYRAVLCAVLMQAGSLAWAQCGTTVYDPGGTGQYPNNSNWTVTYCPAVPGQVVTLNFTAFATELGYDFLFIHNGNTVGSTLIGQYNGTVSPGVVTSTAPNGCLTLHFVSDLSGRAAGWTATVTCSAPPSPCGTTVYDPGGTANYGYESYWIRTYCPAVAGQAVTINFSSFNTEATYDVLTIYNGPNTSGQVVGTYSGTTLPASFTSVSPDGCVTLMFTSDDLVNAAGWVASVTCAPRPAPPAGTCRLVLSMNDSGNNGWGTSRVGVSINGGATTWYTVASASNHVLIGVNPGDILALNYDASGPNQAQNSYSLTSHTDPCPALFRAGPSPAAGIQFVQTVNCQPPLTAMEDCTGGFTICNSGTLSNSARSTGCSMDLHTGNRGCLQGNERRGTWYFFSPTQTGTVGFQLTPMNAGVPVNIDYDFAIWGPMVTAVCPPPSPPVRCSWAYPPNAGTYLTGMGNGAVDLSENDLGNGFVAPLAVTAGQVYVMYIDNFELGSESFQLTWNVSNGASLDCAVLPVELVDLHAVPKGDEVHLVWATLSELYSDHFLIERSADGTDFDVIGRMLALGYSSSMVEYTFVDERPLPGINYYRLRQVDQDATAELSQTVTALFKRAHGEPVVVPNPFTDNAQVILEDVLAVPASYRITDASGRLVQERALALPKGVEQFTISMTGTDAGSYFLVILDEKGAPLGYTRFVKH